VKEFYLNQTLDRDSSKHFLDFFLMASLAIFFSIVFTKEEYSF